MDALPSALLPCPYCGEQIDLLVDGGDGRQEYVEDCQVCCRPIVVTVELRAGEIISLDLRREDD